MTKLNSNIGGTSEDYNEDNFFNSFMEEVMGDTAPEEVEVEVQSVEVKDSCNNGMDSVVVTSDGRTLSDMLPGLGSRRSSLSSTITGIKSKRVPKEETARYTKHVEVIDKEQAENEERSALSMKFLQRNAEFSEQEKTIMKNLGLTNNELADTMRSKDISLKRKEEILGLGRYGAKKHFKGRRYRTSVGDTSILEFLVKFKFANTRILRWINNEPQGRTWRKLSRMRDSGLAESKTIIGVPDLWGATHSGVALNGSSLKPGLRPMPKMSTISNDMGVNYIAACLWFNTVNVLNLEDFPATNRLIATQEDGRERVRGEMLVSELEIRSSIGTEISEVSTTIDKLPGERLYDSISSTIRRELQDWKSNGMIGSSPEFSKGNEFMWALFPVTGLTSSYHIPNLVVRRDKGPNGEPRSIAVEMERYKKSNDMYEETMLAYKLDNDIYGHSVWITPSSSTARRLQRAADAVGLENYSIIPIITEDGIYEKDDIWMI